MKKQQLKQRTLELLVEIHRGFLTREQSDQATDEEVLAGVPENQGTYLYRADDSKEARVSAFTYRWVKQRVKKNPLVQSYELLKEAGFR